MFTGIIETKSNILESRQNKDMLVLSIARPRDWELQVGQSIAVDGACLTVETFDTKSFTVTLIPETLAKTTFGNGVPEEVNLERAMLPTDRFEGHIVQGHVDATGTIASITNKDGAVVLRINYNLKLNNLLVAKGSITVHGVSLTVVDVEDGEFSVALIPHTLAVTTLGGLSQGDEVNLEFDIIGKYIARQSK